MLRGGEGAAGAAAFGRRLARSAFQNAAAAASYSSGTVFSWGRGGEGAVGAAAAGRRLARGALQSAAAAYSSGTVFSWGRGLEGQCGIEGGPASAAVVPRPTPLIELHGRAVARLSAGRLSSAAVTDGGEALTWGDGRSGLLAHGSGQAALRVQAPQRVEALYGRAHVVGAVALGDAHALFVSGDGAAFACGENKEGQCGLGTPLEVLAAQHRRALGPGWGPAGGGGGGAAAVAANAARLREAVLAAIRGGRPPPASGSSSPSSSSSSAGGGAGGGWRSAAAAATWGPPGAGAGPRRGGGAGGGAWGGSSASPQQQQQRQHQQPPQQTSLRDFVHAIRPGGGGGGAGGPGAGGGGHGASGFSPSAAFAAPSPLHAGWAGAGASAQRGGGAAEVARAGGLLAAAALGGGGGLGGGPSSGGGGVGTGWDSVLQPGQVGHPVRVGSDRHALWGENDDEAADADAACLSSSSSSSSSDEPSISCERVVAASASRYYSALLTARGEVFTFGSDFNGALGSANGTSWQPSPRRVGGALGAALADGGGAVAVAAGGGFAAAVTREGGVLLWGRLGTAGAADGSTGQEDEEAEEGAWQMGPAPASAATRRRRGGGRPSSSSQQQSLLRAVPGAAVPAWSLGGGPSCPVLPHRITSVAAGQRHVLLSDGARVWAAGAWLDGRGRPAGSAPLWRPKLLLDLECEGGVARLSAGPHASAVVSGDGRLYLWGRLLDRAVAEEAWRGAAAMAAAAAAASGGGGGGRGGGMGGDAWTEAALRRQRSAADFSWAGFGGDRPRLVPELTGVRDVALGGHHALVLAD